ncbi:MAG: YcaO-like family protein [Planctomycetales bacterium]|nr:YcaO-like family protein [Planctomycetales bacterium]
MSQVELARRWRVCTKGREPLAPLTGGRLSDLARRIGVTRVASTTLLDRIGVPTGYAVRPAALHPAAIYSSGKGTTRFEADVTAVFESYERWAAEESLYSFVATLPQLARWAKTLDFQYIVPDEFDEIREHRWSLGKDIAGDRVLAMPSEWVEFPPSASFAYRCSTTGLAAHADLGQAILSGVLECLERHHTAGLAVEGLSRIDGRGFGQLARSLLERFTANDIEAHCFSLAETAAYCVVYCYGFDHALRFPQMHCSGFAAGVDMHRALVAALMEIAQGRAAFASGLRDDVARAIRLKETNACRDALQLSWLESLRSVSTLAIRQSAERSEKRMPSRELASELKVSAGVETIGCFPLRQVLDYPAVRIVVPELNDCD